jgi:hypothetical protein
MEYGVAMARRAWLTPDRILNCWPQVADLGVARRSRSTFVNSRILRR